VALRATHLADKSALSRFRYPAVAARLGPLLEEGLIATCAIVDLEVLFSARGLDDYEAVLAERRSLDDLPITPAVMARAVEVQHALAQRGQHRVSIPDLIIAASAELAGVAVIHYDSDFDQIAAITGQPQEWVVLRGSV